MSDPEPKPRSATTKDIARAAGLSYSAVSLALRNCPGVSKATCKRVQALARKMGYEPNPMAVELVHHRHQSRSVPMQAVIAWINGWPNPGELRAHQQFEAYWNGASRAAKKFGYRLEEFEVNERMPLTRIEKILRVRNINGILVPPHGAFKVAWDTINWNYFSVVRFGLTARNLPHFHSVTSDQSGNAYLAFTKMVEKGYQRIGFLGLVDKVWRGLAGFAQAQFTVPKNQRVPPLLFHFEEGPGEKEKLHRWIEKHRPDAILIEHAKSFTHLKPLGYEWPRDFGLAGGAIPDIPVDAGIDHNPQEIGRVAILMLLSQIRDNARGVPPLSRMSLVEGTWVDGSSLPSRR
jgi:LacI family transcriptional regulator